MEMLIQLTLPIKVAHKVGIIVQLTGVTGALLETSIYMDYQNGICQESRNRSTDKGQGTIYLSDLNDQALDYKKNESEPQFS